MDYTITEDEWNTVDAVRGQLGLVSGLLAATGSHPSLYEAADLCDFLAAQCDALKAVLHAVEERHEATRDEDTRLTWIDWSNALRILGGTRSFSAYAERSITDKLVRHAQVHPDMQHVLDVWIEALATREEPG